MADAGIPPIVATENEPVFVCREPSRGDRNWIIISEAAAKTRA